MSKFNVAKNAGNLVEKTFTGAGKAIKNTPKFAKNHPKTSIGVGAYTLGYSARGSVDRNRARSAEANRMMTHTEVRYRAQDKHPYGANYGA